MNMFDYIRKVKDDVRMNVVQAKHAFYERDEAKKRQKYVDRLQLLPAEYAGPQRSIIQDVEREEEYWKRRKADTSARFKRIGKRMAIKKRNNPFKTRNVFQ